MRRLVLVLLPLLVPAGAAQTLVVQLDYDQGTVSLANLTFELLPPPRTHDPGRGYRLELEGPDGRAVHRLNFSFPTEVVSIPKKEWFDPTGRQVYTPSAGGTSGTPPPAVRANVTLRVPHFPTAVRLAVYDPGGDRVLSASLADHLCLSDGACRLPESALLCPAECPTGSPDGYCDGARDDRCDPDCIRGEDLDCPNPVAAQASELRRAVENRTNGSPAAAILPPSPAGAGPAVPPLPSPTCRGLLCLPGFEAALALMAILLVALAGRRFLR